VRIYVSTWPEHVPTPVMLTSFPALKGASGAPIFTLSKACSSIFSGEYRDETRYFLPCGKALGRVVIAKCLEGLGVPFEYADSEDASSTA
jgi:hypothetical protein